MANSFEAYRELLPLALAWMLNVEQATLSEKIRILTVDKIEQPEDPQLLQAMTEIGMATEGVAGRAIGYSVEIAEGAESRPLLRHEFRHIYQFEQAGSLANFVEVYVKSLLADGYARAEGRQRRYHCTVVLWYRPASRADSLLLNIPRR